MSDCGRPVSCSLCTALTQLQVYPVVNQPSTKERNIRPFFALRMASSSDDAIQERSNNKEANLWIHATSKANLAKVRNDGYLRPHQNNQTSRRYDSKLTDKHGPAGVWFNCHYMADGCLLTKTPYPESCEDNEVEGLVAHVDNLLTSGGTDRDLEWELFRVSENYVSNGTRCVNYVCVASGSPWPAWLRERFRHGKLPRNECDDDGAGGYVIRDQLEWSPSGQSVRIELRRKDRHWTWNAVPLARGKSAMRSAHVAVFLVSPYRPSTHSDFPIGALPLEWFSNAKEPRRLKHKSSPAKTKSPGELEPYAASPSCTPAGSSSVGRCCSQSHQRARG